MYKLDTSQYPLDLDLILDTGQVFRYEILAEDKYLLIYKNQYVIVEKKEGSYAFECDEDTFEKIWRPYLALNRDYPSMLKTLSQQHPELENMIQRFKGLRLLRQDPFEMLITFIISQSKSMVQIRRLVNQLARDYGQKLYEENNYEIHAFPRAEDLQAMTENDFRNLKFGYRAPYLVDAIEKVASTQLDLERTSKLPSPECIETLMKIKGVGPKVASCVALFGMGKYEVFPVDTWVLKIMRETYGTKEEKVLSPKGAEELGKALFGPYAGIAQQYLFETARRDNKIIKTL